MSFSRIIKLALIIFLICTFVACDLSQTVHPTREYSIPSRVDSKQISPNFLLHLGSQYVVYQEKDKDSVFVKMFSLLPDSNARVLDVAASSERFSNWADFPQAISFQNTSLLYHVLKKVPGSVYAYHIQLKTSVNSTALLHSDTTPTEHGFVSYANRRDEIFAVWLDGRDTEGTESSGHHHHESNGSMQLRGRFLASTLEMSPELLLDERVCDCCQTDVVLNSKNELVVFYRDRSEDEIRDIGRVIVGEEGVLSKTLVHSDNWKIGGCPVNGPSAQGIDSTILVAWFTAAAGKNRVKFAVSNNNGWDFDAPVVLDENGVGRCNVIVHENQFLLSWMKRNDNDGAEIVLSVIRDGKEQKRSVLANTSDSRGVGFPKITVLNSELILTYVSGVNDQIIVKHFALNEII